MADFRNMHKLTKYIHDTNTAKKDNEFLDGLLSGFAEGAGLAKVVEITEAYAKEHNMKKSKAVEVYKSALKHKYIQEYKLPMMDKTVDVNPKEGLSFLDSFLFIPIGMIREILNENKTVISIVTATIIGIATVINVIIAIYRINRP